MRADRFLVLVSNGQVAALSDWAYYQYALVLQCLYSVASQDSALCAGVEPMQMSSMLGYSVSN